MNEYDAIIIGTGAAGGIVACVLAEAGKHVLLLERGAALSFADVGRDDLRNQRLAVYGHNAGPDVIGNPRVFVDPQGRSRIVKPYELDYHNNAACVGGGTRVYGAQAWRFHPDDFRMFEAEALKMGFVNAACGPMVRSSYHADLQAKDV